MAQDAPLIVSVSGVRGVVGQSLTPRVVADFVACYGTPLAGQQVVVSRDGRASGEMLRHATLTGLMAVGCHVVDIGIAATPTCGYYVRATGAAGAVQITASHNPPQWNGLKLFRPEGFVLGSQAGQRVADDYRSQAQRYVGWDRLAPVQTISDPHALHLEKVLSLVDVDAIRARGFHVVFDANHGAGAVFGERLLQQLGCRVDVLGGTPDGLFEHQPEPTEANLGGLCSAVSSAGADIGFAVDPDADRLAIVDDRGNYIGEEYTLALVIGHRASAGTGPVVINSSTSRLSEDAAKACDRAVVRTKVGEVHVAERMSAEGSVIGGEGNGGVIDPRVGLGRDSAIGMALVLDCLAARNSSVSEQVAQLPRYTIQKDKVSVVREQLPEIFDEVACQFSDGVIDRSDGLRVDWDDAWVQVRASNTEPIVRVIAEAGREERAGELCEKIRQLVTKRNR